MLPAVPPIVIGAFFRCSAHLLVAFPSSSTAKGWLSPHPYPHPHPQTDRAARRRKRVRTSSAFSSRPIRHVSHVPDAAPAYLQLTIQLINVLELMTAAKCRGKTFVCFSQSFAR
ncbi:hypothetical protein [Burkholderia cenocepacia]|uniref:hypothetical protein n=1 Tax=Burkholderia cenocepacia TaxID=95486 RepID=UPI001FC7E1D2|nr:hypothetical protein [Burkholderia cenocepacia]